MGKEVSLIRHVSEKSVYWTQFNFEYVNTKFYIILKNTFTVLFYFKCICFSLHFTFILKQ